jgi:hypothetical protein
MSDIHCGHPSSDIRILDMNDSKQNLVVLVGVFLLVSLAGCVGAQFNDTAPIRDGITEQYLKTSELFKDAQRDYSEKSYLYKNLEETIKTPGLAANLSGHLNSMTTLKDKLNLLHENLEVSQTRLLHLIQNKKQISSKDPEWNSEQSLIGSFNTHMQLFNKALGDYSHESAIFAQIISDNKLVVIAKVSEIRSRLSEDINKAKLSLQMMDSNIQSAQKRAIQNGHPMDDVSLQTVQAERNAFLDQLKALQKIHNTLKVNYGDRTRISTSDKGWSEFQNLVTESEIRSKDMHDIAARLPLELGKFKQ